MPCSAWCLITCSAPLTTISTLQDRGRVLQAGSDRHILLRLVHDHLQWPLKTITTAQDRGRALQAGLDSHALLQLVLDHVQCGTLSLMCKHEFLEQASVARHQLCTCSRDLQQLEVHGASTTYSACQTRPVARSVDSGPQEVVAYHGRWSSSICHLGKGGYMKCNEKDCSSGSHNSAGFVHSHLAVGLEDNRHQAAQTGSCQVHELPGRVNSANTRTARPGCTQDKALPLLRPRPGQLRPF